MNNREIHKVQERRRYKRYDTSNISIALKPCEDLKTNNSLNIIDFNRYGLALYSKQNFRVGETLHLSLSDKSGYDIEVEGFVCNRTPSGEGFRCGLRFIETNDSGEAQTMRLFEMEQTLERLAS